MFDSPEAMKLLQKTKNESIKNRLENIENAIKALQLKVDQLVANTSPKIYNINIISK